MASKQFSHVVQVTVVKAKDLRDADISGKSDPYCVVKVKGAEQRHPDEFRTEVVPDCLDPEWNAISAFLVEDKPDTPLEVSIKLYDEDRGGDDALGKICVELDKNGFGAEGWHEIKHGSGEIYLKCAAVPLDEIGSLKSSVLGLQNELAQMKAEDVAEKAQLAELQNKISELETDDAADEEEKAAFRAQLQRMQKLADVRAQTTWIHCDSCSAVESVGNVVLGGHEPNGMQQYVGQKAYDGAILPCKILPAANIALFGYGGKEHVCKGGVEVLSVPAELTEWANFPLSNEQKGRAIVVGRQTNGAKVYAARGPVEAGVQIGHLYENGTIAEFPFGGVEKRFDEFDVLLYKLE